MLNLVDRDRTLGKPILAARPEMAVRLTDVLIRRLHLFYEDPAHGTAAAPAVAARMAKVLNWDQARQEAEVAAYGAEVKRARAFLKEVPRTSSAGGP